MKPLAHMPQTLRILIFQDAVRAAYPAERKPAGRQQRPAALCAVQRLAAQIGGDLRAAGREIRRLRVGVQPERQRVGGGEAVTAQLAQLQTGAKHAQAGKGGVSVGAR